MKKWIGMLMLAFLFAWGVTAPSANVSAATSTGWQQVNGHWYYYTTNGKATGWLLSGGKWYYLDSTGIMKTGWILDRGTWYFLDQTGAMKTGWVLDRGTWYYLDASGAMKTGWIMYHGTWYYLDANGAMSKVELNVPYVSQLTPTYAPMGCEGASLLMALKDKGYTNESLKTFLDKMPKTTNNPYIAFSGSPYKIINGVFQSIFPKPLTAFGQKYSSKVANATGYTTTQLKQELDNGNPVVVYVTLNFAKPVWAKYNMGSAGYVNIVDNMHVMTLIGYDKHTGKYYVADPDSRSSNNKYWVSQSAFETAYNALKYAVVVR